MSKKAVVLLSGGLDSTTTLAVAKSEGYLCYALSFDYGQTLRSELDAAKNIAKYMQVADHKVMAFNLAGLGGSALTDPSIAIPDYQGDGKIPSTYVPARNTIFLSVALGWAEILGAFDIFLGANILDYSGYPDCRPEYFKAFEKVAKLATKAGVEGAEFTIHTPLIQMHKHEIIQLGMKLGIDYGKTVSCYRANAEGQACGRCDSCTYRKKGFAEIGVEDPTRYVER